MKKSLSVTAFYLIALAIGLNACGSPTTTQAQRPGTDTSALKAEEPVAKVDKEKKTDKLSKAEQQANLRRDIQLKKDTMSRIQQNLTRKENLLSQLQGRLVNVNLEKASTVPKASSGSVLGAIVTENPAGAIGAYASKKSATEAAAKSIANLSALEADLAQQLKTATDEVAALEIEVEDLEADIAEMTIQLNEIS